MEPKTKVVDLSFLKGFTKGDTEKLILYIKMYLDTASKLFDELLNHALKKNWEEVYLKAHNLKAQAQYVGITGMKEMLEEVEMVAKKNDDKSSLAELVFTAVKLNNHATTELKIYIASRSLLKS